MKELADTGSRSSSATIECNRLISFLCRMEVSPQLEHEVKEVLKSGLGLAIDYLRSELDCTDLAFQPIEDCV